MKKYILFLILLGILIVTTAAIQFHTLDQLYGGVSPYGNYTFNGSLNVYGQNNINIKFPDGLEGETKLLNLTAGYTVPQNKTLYIFSVFYSNPGANTYIYIDNNPVFYIYTTSNWDTNPTSFNSPLVVAGNSTINDSGGTSWYTWATGYEK